MRIPLPHAEQPDAGWRRAVLERIADAWPRGGPERGAEAGPAAASLVTATPAVSSPAVSSPAVSSPASRVPSQVRDMPRVSG